MNDCNQISDLALLPDHLQSRCVKKKGHKVIAGFDNTWHDGGNGFRWYSEKQEKAARRTSSVGGAETVTEAVPNS
jgi:hypothetical protein